MMSRALLARLLVVGLIACAGVFTWSRLDNGLDYRHVVTRDDLLLLGAATALLSSTVLIYGLVSCRLLDWLLPAAQTPPGRLNLFVYTWPLRYIPGTMPYHVGRILLAERLGATRPVMVAVLIYENILQLGSAGIVGLTSLLIGVGLDTRMILPYVLVGLLIAGIPIAVQPRVLLPVASAILRLMRREPLLPNSVLSSERTLSACVAYGLAHCLQGLAFCLVLRAVSDSGLNMLLVGGTYVLAAGVGMVALFVPSGLGVREGVIVAVLGTAVSPETALLAAGLARLVSVVGDLVPFLLLGSLEVLQGLWRRRHTAMGTFSFRSRSAHDG